MKCTDHPKAEWKPHDELAQKLTKEGWKIRRMEMTKSCYEVYAKDPQGKRIEAFFNPVTWSALKKNKLQVWDAPVRLMHWLLVLSIAGAWYTGSQIGATHE